MTTMTPRHERQPKPISLPVLPIAIPPAPPELTASGTPRIPETTIAQRIAAIRAARDEWRRAQEC